MPSRSRAGLEAAQAWLHVAKHREHDAADFRAALAATDRARALAERGRLFGRRDRLVERDLATSGAAASEAPGRVRGLRVRPARARRFPAMR